MTKFQFSWNFPGFKTESHLPWNLPQPWENGLLGSPPPGQEPPNNPGLAWVWVLETMAQSHWHMFIPSTEEAIGFQALEQSSLF